MGEYLNYLIDPITRQARRFSQISQNNINESVLLAESFGRWTPGRLWSGSPTPEDEEDDTGGERDNDALLDYGPQSIDFWRSRSVLMPSPPLDAIQNDIVEEPQTIEEETPFPDLEPHTVAVASAGQALHRQPHRTDSEQSLNPLRHLSQRSRIHEEDIERGRGSFDSLSQTSHHRTSNSSPERPTTQRSRDDSGALPEDDGMAQLRDRIKAVWREEGSHATKSMKIHLLMMEKYNASQRKNSGSQGLVTAYMPATPPNSSPKMLAAQVVSSPQSTHPVVQTFELLPSDIDLSFAPPQPREKREETSDDPEEAMEEDSVHLGCKHYIRNVKPQCEICRRFYPCRLCHDEAVTDHKLPRHLTKNMLCMRCLTPQPAAQWCKNCGECAGTYYCVVCKLWNSDPEKSVYHCDDCGICRLGQGLGKDFYHCPVCAVCISISVAQSHRCIEQSTKCDCPICGEYMFTSPDSVVFMRCGHSIHESCFKDWCKTAYKCPICSRSIVNMETQFRRLDRHIAGQPMPEEYRDAKALVNCNDCLMKSVVAFHWLGLKCENCEGYNTTQLDFIGAPELNDEPEPERQPLTPQEESAGELIPDAMAQHATVVAGDQRPPTAISDVAASASSPWLIPCRSGPRSASPVVSNYFGLERRDDQQMSAHNPDEPEEELEFWGGRSPRSFESLRLFGGGGRGRPGNEESDSDESMEDEDDDDMDEDMDDDDDPEDEIVLFGHR